MRTKEEILGRPQHFDTQMRQDTYYKDYVLLSMKLAQLDVLNEFYNRLPDFAKFYAEETYSELKEELQ